MKPQFLLLFLFTLLCLIVPQGQTSATLTSEQKSWLAKANRHEKNGWIYVHIEGAAMERGFQHGYLLANEIKEGLRIKKNMGVFECNGVVLACR